MEYNLKLYQKVIKYLLTFQQTYFGFIVITFRFLFNLNKNHSANFDNEITLVITSCNRYENLKKTLDSFTRFNTYHFKKIIHIEDGQCSRSIELVKSLFNRCEIVSLFNEKNIGQLNSIDKAYSFVKTEFLFHLEDDWTFLDFGFIEYSKSILESYKNVLFVSLRSFDDQNKHPLIDFDNNFLQFMPFWKLTWVGFGFNPSLRRTHEYFIISKFGGINKRETGIGLFYFIFLKKRMIVSKKHFYVQHNGWEVSTVNKYNKA